MAKLEKNALEWTVFGLSLLLVVAVLGGLIYWAVVGTDLPPRLEVRLGEAEQRGERFYVPVFVHNGGDETAEAVQVVVTVQGREMTEEGRFELDFVPGHSTRDGEVTLEADPAEAQSTAARIAGYRLP